MVVVYVPSVLWEFVWVKLYHGAQFCHNLGYLDTLELAVQIFTNEGLAVAPSPSGHKSIQIRFLFFHTLPCATIAFRALLSPLFYVRWKIRFPSPTPVSLD